MPILWLTPLFGVIFSFKDKTQIQKVDDRKLI